MKGRKRAAVVESSAPSEHRYDIRWPDGADRPILFTRYRGHAFEGWISEEAFAKAEAEGLLRWDESGRPVVSDPEADRLVAGDQPEPIAP